MMTLRPFAVGFGMLSLAGSLSIAQTYSAGDLPRTISAFGTPTVTSRINVPSGTGTLAAVQVELSIDHTWVEDLDIALIHPDGTRVELSSDNGNSGDNYSNTLFDAQAETSITDGAAPFTGTYRPEGNLGVLTGKSAEGDWTLEVFDDTSQDGGALKAWSLVLTSDGGPDRDGDGLPNIWESANGLDPDDDGTVNPDNGAYGDPDGDGLPNDEEYFLGSNPQVNEYGRPYEPRPEKAQLMVIAAHPDDEGIFYGGLLPYYTQVRNVDTVYVAVTSGDFNREPEVREAELRSALWTYGLRNQPVCLRFKDFWANLPTTGDPSFDVWADGVEDGQGIAEGRLKIASALASRIRRYRPEVVITHDLGGEYGHTNHIAAAEATVDAYALAADAEVDLGGLPPWQVKKLYVHSYETNRLFHEHWQDVSIDTDGDGQPDQTPVQVANEGLKAHVTQGFQGVSTCYAFRETSNATFEPYPGEYWGLHSSTVGLDTVAGDWTGPDPDNQTMTYSGWARGDFFEHLSIASGAMDRDGDQLPDWWETQQGLDPEVADAEEDADGDSFSNQQEYLADTDPTQNDDLPRFGLDLSNGSPRLKFDTSSRRKYILEYCDDLSEGLWRTLAPLQAGTGAEVEVEDTAGAPNRFYRVRVALP